MQQLDVVKTVKAIIPLGEFALNAYMLTNGEKRFDVEDIGLVFGYTRCWFYESVNQESKWMKKLRMAGFDGTEQSLQTTEDSGETVIIQTISLRDFIQLAVCESVVNGNIRAVILLAALAEVGLESS